MRGAHEEGEGLFEEEVREDRADDDGERAHRSDEDGFGESAGLDCQLCEYVSCAQQQTRKIRKKVTLTMPRNSGSLR